MGDEKPVIWIWCSDDWIEAHDMGLPVSCLWTVAEDLGFCDVEPGTVADCRGDEADEA